MPDLAAAESLRHSVLFYDDVGEYRTAISRFMTAGLASKEPVLVAIPQARSVLPDWLVSAPGVVTVADMTELGRNPARIIPALRGFADRHLGQRVRIISEAIWPGRTAAELREGARYDALVDQALAGVAATMVCPYSKAHLAPSVLSDAACIHQWEFGPDTVKPSAAYVGPSTFPAACRVPLPSPPPSAEAVEYESDLRPVRALIRAVGERAGLARNHLMDLVLAASEVAANTLRHTRDGGVARAWQAGNELLCEIADSGFIADPLAGLRRPALDESGGQGLWLVNQVCDLVETRTSEEGTIVRLHMRLPDTR